jgi:predicted ATPase/class 3 adenylate cyclase
VAMGELPSGTVTLLFSDIEGSTVLLGRLGPAYAEALDAQRRVLRRAWAGHGGTELGTEGDSFFVVFPTAEGAVAAAVQAQRELAEYPWPSGERVRVRMGVHTGSPQVHDGGYVGMDVHRAARIAAAAHGGQVVVSEATAHLLPRAGMDGVRLMDLGSHQLKDLPQAEHLFQLVYGDLPADFPPLRSLGAVSSLPRPATPLVGRDGELAELTALLSPEVRLVTLTGPGGSGKTRLAIGVAQRLVDHFPDGVFFVALASVTSPEAMWASIAEALDVPPEARTPSALFGHVAHRRALLVLDNLEQLAGADRVVAELLDAAPCIRVLATSRRPLHLPGEQEHPVPPLELPESSDVEKASASGAVQMFVQQARLVRPGFALTPDNAAEVAAVCRRLDGLPLAIELAATRSKLLSPRALLARLGSALDLAASGSTVQRRQKTLRDTIAWSYQLLDPMQQAVFRRLGVFAGGADLDAITAVTADLTAAADPLELVGNLVDASLATITDDEAGEPRVGLLETIRAYAHDQLTSAGELNHVRRSHAAHYQGVAEQLEPLLSGAAVQPLAARRRFAVELDNLREALGWALQPEHPAGTVSAEQLRIGRNILAASADLWRNGGYYAEARRWLERAVSATATGDGVEPEGVQPDTVELGRCLEQLGDIASWQCDFTPARTAAIQSVAMLRRLDARQPLISALNHLANVEYSLRDLPAARDAIHEAIMLAEEIGNRKGLAVLLYREARIEIQEGNFERSVESFDAAAATYLEVGDETAALVCRYDSSAPLRLMGRLADSHRQLSELIPHVLRLADPDWLVAMAEDYGAVMAELGEHHRAARLLGAADAMRERKGNPRPPNQQAEIADAYAIAQAALPSETWQHEYQSGRNLTVEDALTETHTADSPE